MNIQGNVKFGQGYWVDRFIPTPASATTVVSGGGSNTRTSFNETPDGVRTAFTLPSSPSANNIEVFRNGLLLSLNDDYSVSGSTVTFSQALQLGDTLVTYYGGGSVRQSYTGNIDGNNKVFTFQNTPLATVLQLFWNGMLQFEGNDYTLSNNQITLAIAPKVGDTLVAYF